MNLNIQNLLDLKLWKYNYMWIVLIGIIGYLSLLFMFLIIINNNDEIKKKIFRKNNNIQQNFEYYLESFPITDNFPSRPLIEYNFFGETKKSGKRMKEYNFRIEEMNKNWKIHSKNKSKEFNEIMNILKEKIYSPEIKKYTKFTRFEIMEI